ncbi:MAG TPA: GNAT family N-acetyltransferase [Gemmata sp.]|jgi:hypothetical protein|nr:GNAT family N-acetyltransferase [Gemmata sp.]
MGSRRRSSKSNDDQSAGETDALVRERQITMDRLCVTFASEADRKSIYHLRHTVYASELAQHTSNFEERLSDPLDQFNKYIVAKIDTEIVGFVSITPPGNDSYSIDKYFSRSDLPFPIDATLYEVRLLTIPVHRRGLGLAGLLMYAAFRWIESRGGTRIVALGRRELSGFYCKAGLQMLGQNVQAGSVTYELMSATISSLRKQLPRFTTALLKQEKSVLWCLDIPFFVEEHCYHGGAFFEAVGETFKTLERSTKVINADVLDAWFPPAPAVVSVVKEYLPGC